MIVNGIEVHRHQISYDKIIKKTLAQSSELTVRFINGLFNDDMPLNSPVEWLDKETINDRNTGIVADFYPRVGGRMYAIEIEQDGSGDMAVRVFKYTFGGAIYHDMIATIAELSITLPQPCVIFLSSTRNTPNELKWNINLFDGQKVSVLVPVIKLARLSVREIAERDLLPIGQFYLRTFGKLNAKNAGKFKEAAKALLNEVRKAVENETLPLHIGMQMQDSIRITFENAIIKSKGKVDFDDMTTNITETLPWTDYKDLLMKIEERGITKGKAEGIAEGKAEGIAVGKAEGIAEGIAEVQMNIAMKALRKLSSGNSAQPIIDMLKDLGIPDSIISSARKNIETGNN